MKVRAQILLKNGLIASAVGVTALLLSAGGANAQAGRYQNQQAQMEYQRQAQARQAENYANQVRMAQELAAKREAYARQEQQRISRARAEQEALQRQIQSQRDVAAWQESVRQERMARSLAEQQRNAKSDPTNSWQYKTVEKAAPVVKGVRNCAAGAVVGGISYGPGGAIAGCPAGVVGLSRGGVIIKGLKPEQAY